MFGFKMLIFNGCTFPETNITPENGWLEEEFWEDLPFSGAMLLLGSGSHPTMIHLDQILDATDHPRDDSHPNVGYHSFPGDGDVLTSTRLLDAIWFCRKHSQLKNMFFNIRDVNEYSYEEGVLM